MAFPSAQIPSWTELNRSDVHDENYLWFSVNRPASQSSPYTLTQQTIKREKKAKGGGGGGGGR